ncbi:MAG: 50S ribosome-binding GTPase [Cardiobacteriaceae bacterium]|nr:50S ribosome-binding GTPase [Cardiobacteriaceae bacterium]
MNSVKLLRRIFILLAVMTVAAVCLVIFQITDLGLSIYERIQRLPLWWWIPYLLLISLISAGIGWLFWKIYRFGKSDTIQKKEEILTRPTIDSVREKLEDARESGFSSLAIETQLKSIEAETGEEPRRLEIAFFGKISTGKSSLIRTIIPDAQVEVSIIGGSTAEIERYQYRLGNLDLTLSDMPGTHLAQSVAHLDSELLNDARRMHIVCYVMDQDITASDKESLELLHKWNKPLVAVLNKANRYSAQDRELLHAHISAVLPANTPLVFTESSYLRTVNKVLADGSMASEERMSKGNVAALLQVFADIEGRRGELGEKQRQALIELADETLSKQIADFRSDRAKAIVKAYAQKAIFGGMAAVGPGTDVIIQGYLGMGMVKSLGKLYGIPIKEVDIQTLLTEATGKAKTHITLLLAVAGNICKAFPGVGTVLGGATHAIAYGLIFDSLGMAIADAMAGQVQGQSTLTAAEVMQKFDARLADNLEQRALSLLKSATSNNNNQL